MMRSESRDCLPSSFFFHSPRKTERRGSMWCLPHLSTVIPSTTSCRRSRNRIRCPCVLHQSQIRNRNDDSAWCGWWREEMGRRKEGRGRWRSGGDVVDWPAKVQEASQPNLPALCFLWSPPRLGHGVRLRPRHQLYMGCWRDLRG